MATVKEEILKSFFGKLTGSDEFDDRTIDALHSLLESGKKLKADEVASVLKGKTEGAE